MPTWDDVVAIGSRFPVRPEIVDPTELAELLEEAWRLRAPKRLVATYDASGRRAPGGATPAPA